MTLKKIEKTNTTTDDSDFTTKKDGIYCSIIIPVYNNVNFTKLALEGLLQLPNKYEIIIVDNGSDDETPDMVAELLNNADSDKASIMYIGCDRNLGFGRANNKGYKHSNGEYVLFLNNDIRIDDRYEDWPEILIESAKGGNIVCTQGGVLDKRYNFVKEGKGFEQTELWYSSGWCLCASKDTFDKLILDQYSHDETDELCDGEAWGPWNELFFAYFEDGDLTWRAKELDIDFVEVDIPVHHFGRATGKKLNLNHLYRVSQRKFRKEWPQ